METELLGQDFRQKRHNYEAFTSSVESLLRNLISTTGVEPFAFEGRTKAITSFDEKIQREDKNGKYSCLEDITDLSGVRIICYLQEDCDAVCKIIEEEFEIDYPNSSSKHEEIDPDKFGYLSIHYVVSLNESRAKLKEFIAFDGLKAEIQVRTLLQHTWAAIDWKFRYKEEQESPKALRRRLFRISALLEAADNEFSQVKVELDDLREKYATSLAKGNLNIAINSESIHAYLSESETVKAILSAAESTGIKILSKPSSVAEKRLASSATYLGYATIEDLDRALKQIQEKSENYFKFIMNHLKSLPIRKTYQIMTPAVVRYFLLGFAPSGKRQLINKEFPPAEGFAEAMAAFDRNRKDGGDV